MDHSVKVTCPCITQDSHCWTKRTHFEYNFPFRVIPFGATLVVLSDSNYKHVLALVGATISTRLDRFSTPTLGEVFDPKMKQKIRKPRCTDDGSKHLELKLVYSLFLIQRN